MTDVDGYALNGDGTVTFELEDGVVRKLKRPTLAEYRTVLEALSDLRGDILEQQKQLDGLEGEELEAKKREIAETVDLKSQLNTFLSWLDVVFTTLAGEGLPRAADGTFDDSKLPVWITSATVIQDLVAHWQTVPSRRGGQ